MKSVEIIALRASGTDRAKLNSMLARVVEEIGEAAGKDGFSAYRRLMVDTDFSIHLVHDSAQGQDGRSPLGLHLASMLKEYGLVSHSIWVDAVE